ncbi:bifunctional 2-polyprenyl-6-hydroxyphenol methylase/3-demethylubiquinol 3-O-methyltransferase UbiG [Arthrobacter sp. UKPF54-2]|uniref:class I SAM-dependent methyltransferase n=1 Tax=Arthrobacter sp. UKPF54-2 TaxID=2600159 RepID=UPI0021BD1CB1|nr:class I SAM-dependent methyltransferase [Arthrobacter sp. UKPF54-2]
MNPGPGPGPGPGYAAYAAKMRGLMDAGVDLEVDARFVDMLSPRRAHILDLGCGIGSAVGALRARGHMAYGVDPSDDVLTVARELFDPACFQDMSAGAVSASALPARGLPGAFDFVFMSGNVPAFLTDDALPKIFKQVSSILNPGGGLIIGTSTKAKGGPAQQDVAAAGSGLTLTHRFSDWHLGPFSEESPWSVSVYSNAGTRRAAEGPDGMFVLGA